MRYQISSASTSGGVFRVCYSLKGTVVQCNALALNYMTCSEFFKMHFCDFCGLVVAGAVEFTPNLVVDGYIGVTINIIHTLEQTTFESLDDTTLRNIDKTKNITKKLNVFWLRKTTTKGKIHSTRFNYFLVAISVYNTDISTSSSSLLLLLHCVLQFKIDFDHCHCIPK
ncbi:hypothetical protein FF38_11293 [Lucilia cuprina]|uniref:Uncharacterized protein n=1 Tax=Lucilia cuprina TaxID=7375 RepID=A0A0L0CIV9_LUCCU|nr:hypothetical protein FF38_11293 [Lucilia cuprina]